MVADTTLLNRYVIIPEDNVDSIGKTVMDVYRFHAAGGELDLMFLKIRPQGVITLVREEFCSWCCICSQDD
jgi:hypothetical protein